MWRVLLLFVTVSVANCGKIHDAGVSANPIVKIYSTTRTSLGFNLKQVNFTSAKDASAHILTVNTAVKYQKIIGFGGTFSDATGINLNKLTADVRTKALQALFGADGIGLSLCRVPIGANEYSSRVYTLDDHAGDTTLKQFALANEDLVDKVQYLTN